eukprot:TRINITY_DN1549_c0_g3_i2.p1 TRINITY_DN1549_c0_g3~~TRINITY_DN1549_c0_g3_i2.p1  ORF type:complete len:116 (-),score=9.46 TRINITY_DN1549_c0_g3_i2:82-429(-)
MVLFVFNYVVILPVTIAIFSLLVYQLTLLRQNLTSIETYTNKRLRMEARAQGKRNYMWHYDLGTMKNNFKEIFGKRVKDWFIPIPNTENDGINWRTINDGQLSSLGDVKSHKKHR